MASRQTGTYISSTTAGETVDAFVPRPLPPEPPLELTVQDLAELLDELEQAAGPIEAPVMEEVRRSWPAPAQPESRSV